MPTPPWLPVGTEITFVKEREGVRDTLHDGITTNTKAPASTVEGAQSMLVQLIVHAMGRIVAMGKLAAWRSNYEAAERTRIAMG